MIFFARANHVYRMAVCAICLSIGSQGFAQPFPSDRQANPYAASSSVHELLALGLKLESQRSWIDAIHHYEAGLRKNPAEPQLLRRLQIARLHHDVVRRCSDSAVEQLIRSVSPTQALELYSEVLARLEMSYVDAVQFSELVRGGTAYLEVALTEPAFIETQVDKSQRDRLEPFRLNIHRLTLAKPVSSRLEARQLVAQAADAAQRELGISPTATILQFTLGAIGLLDPYSAFLSPTELNEIESQIEGNFVGLGIALEPHVVPLKILNVIPGGPAREAGLQRHDRILQIGSVRCEEVGAERAADLLRGPEGSQVRLLVETADGQVVDKIIGRRRVEVPSIEEAQLIDQDRKIAYLKISSFQKTTADELDEALWKLHHQGMQSLIVDLRGNPGGWLDASVAVADRFLNEGAIVSTRGKNGIENQNYQAQRSGTWQVPLVLLIDEQSASASEILAGAIRDNNRGALVGNTTYGKGSVQGLFHTRALNCGIRLTVSKFYSPSGQAISDLGVRPTVALHADVNQRVAAKVSSERPNAAVDEALRLAMDQIRPDNFTGFVSTRAN
jgi:carboxyl-terminal processing protease